MEENSILDTLEGSLLDLVDGAVNFVPKILVAIVLLIIGSIVAGIISRLVRRGLAFIETNKHVASNMSRINVSPMQISGLAGTVVRWVIMLIFWGAAVDAIGLPVLTDTFNSLLSFVPRIFAASLVAGLTFIAGRAVKDIVSTAALNSGINQSNMIGSVARIAVLLFGIPLAATQLGLDLTIINNNITMIVAGFMLAFGLAFGLGGREVAGKIVGDIYASFKKGSAHKKTAHKIQ